MSEIDWELVKQRQSLLYLSETPVEAEFLDEGQKMGTFEFHFKVRVDGEIQTLVSKSGRFLGKLAKFVPLTTRVLRMSKTQANFADKPAYNIEAIGPKDVLNQKHGKKAKK